MGTLLFNDDKDLRAFLVPVPIVPIFLSVIPMTKACFWGWGALDIERYSRHVLGEGEFGGVNFLDSAFFIRG